MQGKGWLRTNSTPLKAADIGGNPQKFVMGGDWLAPWANEPDKYAKLKELLWFWREAYKGNNVQWCLNVCKLGGSTKSEILATALAAAGNKDHGSLNNLGNDDHTQYLLADGTRYLGGVLRSRSQYTLLNADANDLSVTRSILVVEPNGASRKITGITAINGGLIKLENIGSQNLVLGNQDGASDAENRIITGLGMDRVIAPGTGVMLAYGYDATDGVGVQRWKVNN